MNYDQIEVLDNGEKITVDEETGELSAPDNPIILIIHGDGIGTNIGPAIQKVLDAVAKATGRSVFWMRVCVGLPVHDKYDENPPEDTMSAIRNHRVATRGSLTTPVGAGFCSFNATLRKKLDLYANARPTYHLDGIPSPVENPSAMGMVAPRENTKDVYAGIEREAGTDKVQKIREFVEEEMGADGVIHDGPVGIGIKPITEPGMKRFVREATEYALENDRPSVTLVHKGSTMKFTEGAFRDWGYELAEEEFGDVTITEDELWEEYDDERPEDKVVAKDYIADNMLQQLLTRTVDYDVIATMNPNGDYMSDAAGAQIGGLGIVSGADLDEGLRLAEPVYGSAPKYAGEDKVNLTAMIFSSRLMFGYMGWKDVGKLTCDVVEKTILDGDVAYDLERQIEGGNKLATGEYTDKVVENIKELV